MAQLAIRGHATRGEEVIEILGILGGSNAFNHIGNNLRAIYYIDENYKNFITCSETKKVCDYIIFTLEEFLKKFPYKVGDKVIDIKTDRIAEIYGAHWSVSNNCTYYDLKRPDNTGFVRSYKFLQPYKEETMEEKADASMAPVLQSEDYSGKRFGYKIPKGYEFDCIKENEIIIKPIKPQYPKTYEECAQILLERASVRNDIGYKGGLLIALQRLLVCRDAYWKIAGEQMGLGKPWKPDWTDNYQKKWIINFYQDEINFTTGPNVHFVFAFPTAEMRDAFFENFKELIEFCKEFL